MRAAHAAEVIRAPEWWGVKLAPLFGVAYGEIALYDMPADEALPLVFCMLASGACLAAFGHLANDACDVESDRLSGKPNRLARWSPVQRGGAALSLLAAAFVPWIVRPISLLPLLLLALNALLLLAYASPPLRLKARGAWGALADAGYAHLLPVLFVVALFDGTSREPGWVEALWILLLGSWAICLGLRSIVIHQIRDRNADAAAGISTLVVQVGTARARQWVSRYVYPAELLALAGLVLVVSLFAPWVAAFFAVLWLGSQGSVALGLRSPRATDPVPAERDAHVPQQLACAVWPPLAFGTDLTLADPRFLPLLLLPMLLCRWAVRSELRSAALLIREAIEKALATLPPEPGKAQPEICPQAAEGGAENGGPTTLVSEPSPQISLVLPDGMSVGGVTSWTLRLASELADRGLHTQLLEHVDPTAAEDAAPLVRRQRIHTPRPFFPTEKEVRAYAPIYRAAVPGVIVPNYSAGAYAACAALARNRTDAPRVIAFAHSDGEYFYRLLSYYEPIIHRFVAVSDVVAERLRARLPRRKNDVVMRPYGVPVAGKLRRAYSDRDQPLRLVYAGRLIQEQKRVLDLARLIGHLAELHVSFDLLVVGDGVARRELERRLTRIRLPEDSQVRFAGAVPHREMDAIWGAADVCVLVSSFEGMSIAMLEAMGNGCVPVVTEVSGARMMLRDGVNGFTVPVGDIEAMAGVLARLSEDRQALPALGARAHEAAASACSLPGYGDWFVSLVEEVWSLSSRRWPDQLPLIPPPGKWGPRPLRAGARLLSHAPFYGSARRRYCSLSDRWSVRAA
jgi:glycosyltransferase involved in cell wall biosynthesis/4-hydroxybenzoate polyprenyltransferase